MTADEIKALVEQLRAIADYPSESAPKTIRNAAVALETLTLENQRLRVDAERYQWLRDLSKPGICAFYLAVGKAFEGIQFKRDSVAAIIDAAMSEYSEEKP